MQLGYVEGAHVDVGLLLGGAAEDGGRFVAEAAAGAQADVLAGFVEGREARQHKQTVGALVVGAQAGLQRQILEDAPVVLGKQAVGLVLVVAGGHAGHGSGFTEIVGDDVAAKHGPVRAEGHEQRSLGIGRELPAGEVIAARLDAAREAADAVFDRQHPLAAQAGIEAQLAAVAVGAVALGVAGGGRVVQGWQVAAGAGFHGGVKPSVERGGVGDVVEQARVDRRGLHLRQVGEVIAAHVAGLLRILRGQHREAQLAGAAGVKGRQVAAALLGLVEQHVQLGRFSRRAAHQVHQARDGVAAVEGRRGALNDFHLPQIQGRNLH